MSPTRLLPIALLALATALHAQVGVDNPNPEQALDVGGKVKIADDATRPTDGTLRYNAPAESFEGYAGGEWQELNAQPDSGPTGVEAVLLYAFDLRPSLGTDGGSEDWTNFVQFLYQNTGFLDSRVTIPNGKLLVIDHISVTGRDEDPNEFFYVGIAGGIATASDDVTNIRNPRIYISGNSSGGTEELTAARSPLLIVRSGDQVIFWNSPDSETAVRVVLQGFLIDQAKLDEFYTY